MTRYRIMRPGPEEAPLFQRVLAAKGTDYRSSASLARSNRIGADGEPVWPLKLRVGR